MWVNYSWKPQCHPIDLTTKRHNYQGLTKLESTLEHRKHQIRDNACCFISALRGSSQTPSCTAFRLECAEALRCAGCDTTAVTRAGMNGLMLAVLGGGHVALLPQLVEHEHHRRPQPLLLRQFAVFSQKR